MANPTFYIKQGDLTPTLDATLLDPNGNPVNLTGTTVRFHMTPVGGAILINQSATVVSAATGQVRYTWTGTDTATAGNYLAEFEVTTGGVQQTYPNDRYISVIITAQLA